MTSTIDSAGRIVIPKAMRDRLGLAAGAVIELTEREGHIEIEPAPTSMRLRKARHGVVAVPETRLPPLTGEAVRETLERIRR